MQYAFIPHVATQQESTESGMSAISERMSLALQGSRQIAFDWQIPDDRLYFSGEFADGLEGVPLAADRIWNSSTLPALVHADDQQNFRRHLREALKGAEGGDNAFYCVELRLMDTIRGWRWVNIRGKVVERSSDGRAVRMVGTFSDIDTRKRADKKIERLGNLYLALSQTNQAFVRASNQDALFREICRIAVEHGRFSLAWIGVINHHEKQVSPVAAFSVQPGLLPNALIPLDKSTLADGGIIGTAVSENRPGICNDIRATPLLHGHSGQPSGLEAAASFPFLLPDQRLGILNLYTAEKDFFDAALVDLLEEMTADISFALDTYARDAQQQSDETILKQNQEILVDNALRYQQLMDLSPDAILVFQKNRMVLLNQTAAHLLRAVDRTDLLGRNVFDFIHPDHDQLFHKNISLLPATAPSSPFIEQVWIRTDGSQFHAEIATTALNYNGIPAIQMVVRDITERKRNEAIQLGQNRILNLIATKSALQDILTEIACFAESQAEFGLCSIRLLDDTGTTLCNHIAPSLPHSYISHEDTLKIGSRSGSCGAAAFLAKPVIVTDIASDAFWSERREFALAHELKACSSWPVIGQNGNTLGTIALYFRKMIAPSALERQLLRICANLAGIAIESRTSEDRIRYLAHYDGLTSLPNRFLFKEYLDLALRSAERHSKKFALLFLDLDKFKDINDTLGHDAGDKVLQSIANRLRNCLRGTDKIARMGGDEFYVLIEDLNDRLCAAEVAQKLLDATSMPVPVGDQECILGVSIGISIYPDDGTDDQTLLKNADNAMYRAKNRGKNGFQFHSPHRRNGGRNAPFTPPLLVHDAADGATKPARSRKQRPKHKREFSHPLINGR